MDEFENDFDESLEIDSYKSASDAYLNTHTKINRELCGNLEKLENGYVELSLITTREMVADDLGLVHGGFVFGAADFAAMAAVNEKNVVLVASSCQFLSPVKFGDVVHFSAKLRHREGKKRNVHVEAFVLDIKVFEGEFKTVVTDNHILKLKLINEEDKKA